MLMFWVTDNFLMYKNPSKRRRRRCSTDESLLHKSDMKYRSARRKKNSTDRGEPESDVLLSADDELLDSESIPIIRSVVT